MNIDIERQCYQIDAPLVILVLLFTGLAVVSLGFILPKCHQYLILFILSGSIYMLTAGLMLRSSKIGKRRVINRLIQSLNLNGNERILDAGCGSGGVTISFAKHLTSGKVTGVDIWSKMDQMNNSFAQTSRNVLLANVSDKVMLSTQDLRAMTFLNHTFDIVISSLVIHNIKSKTDREKVLQEYIRVLKPNGIIILLDFMYINEYKKYFQTMGCGDIKCSKLIYSMFPPVKILEIKMSA